VFAEFVLGVVQGLCGHAQRAGDAVGGGFGAGAEDLANADPLQRGGVLTARKMAAAAITIIAEVQQLREENAALRAQIAWLKQRLFGPGKGETLDCAQLLLQIGELEKIAAAARPVETITY